MKIYKSYLKKILMSPLTFISIIEVSAICITGCTTGTANVHAGVFNAFDAMLDLSSYRKFILFFAALPFVSCFAQEWNCNVPNHIIARSNADNYIFAHITITFFAAFIVCFCGILLGVGSLCLKYTFYPMHYDNRYTEPFLKLLNSKETILPYFFLRALNYSFSIAAWSLSGLALSAVFLNTFMAICAPLVFSYVIEMITIETDYLPNLWYLSLSYTDISENTFIAEAYIILIFGIVSVCFAAVFRHFAKRRIENELH